MSVPRAGETVSPFQMARAIAGTVATRMRNFYEALGFCKVPEFCSSLFRGLDCDSLGFTCVDLPSEGIGLCEGCASDIVDADSGEGCTQSAGDPCLGVHGGLYPCESGTECVAVTDDAGYRCLAP